MIELLRAVLMKFLYIFKLNIDKWSWSDHPLVNSTGYDKWGVVVWFPVNRYPRVSVGGKLVNRPPSFGVSKLGIRA